MISILNYIKQNLTAKLVISLVLFTLIFAVVIAFVQSKNAYNNYLTEKEDYFLFLQDAYAKSILQNAYDINSEKIDLIAEGIINSGKVDYVKIAEFKDTTQLLILTEKGSVSNFGDTLKLSYNQIIPEIKFQQHIQWVLHSHKISFKSFLAQSVFAFILSTLLILLPLALIIYLLMYRTVIMHLRTVTEYTNNFNINQKERPALNLSRINVFAHQNDEIDILQKSINNLISGIIKYNNEKSEFEREITKTNRLLNSAQRLTAIGGWTFDTQENEIYWTDEVYHIHGMKPNRKKSILTELFDKSVNCYLENDRKIILNAFHNCVEKGEIYEMDFQFIDFQKKNKWIRTGAKPIYENNKITAVLGYISDISKEKERVNELKRAKEKAEESDRLKSAFLANMSHEIRTPMNGILGFTDLLLEPDLSSGEKENFINIVQLSGQRLLNTVNDIVEFSKIEAGMVKIREIETDVNSSIEELIRFFKPEAEQKGLKLILEKLLPAEKKNLLTDRNKLDSILTNFIKNAIKYTESGIIWVGCETVERNGSATNAFGGHAYIQFYVKDTGIGIPAEKAEAIFKRFEQADVANTKAFEGSGLGLAISKSYVEMLGGEIWLESEDAVGSTFYFSLPVKNNIEKHST
ncbi:MAG: PAS domain-containing protein [Prolixibacteraceae bacterium]|nr:PAS domain-containing protein [Prolixibacteraceae bacterium]